MSDIDNIFVLGILVKILRQKKILITFLHVRHVAVFKFKL